MARKSKNKTETIFTPRLKDGEEILWVSRPESSLSKQQVIAGITCLLVMIAYFALIFFLRDRISGESIIFLIFIPILLIAFVIEYARQKEGGKSKSEEPDYGTFWGTFAITNQRILGSKLNQEFSLLLLADVSLTEPYKGLCTLYCYYDAHPGGEMPEPIIQIHRLPKYEAQTAYEILRKAREEALEDRAREMGID